MTLNYDAWLEKPYQDQCDWEYKVDKEIDEYRSESRFLDDAKKWAIKKRLNPDEMDRLEDDYLESAECYEYCEERVREWESEWRGDDY